MPQSKRRASCASAARAAGSTARLANAAWATGWPCAPGFRSSAERSCWRPGHLESHSDPQERADQLEVLLDAIDGFAQGAPALIGGDMNTSSLGFEHADPARLGAALRDDPERFGNPVPHEPLFGLLERRGYEWRACNQLDRGTQRKKSPSARGVLHLDWIFCRGLRASAAEVVAAVDPESGEALSDHEAVAVTVSLV